MTPEVAGGPSGATVRKPPKVYIVVLRLAGALTVTVFHTPAEAGRFAAKHLHGWMRAYSTYPERN